MIRAALAYALALLAAGAFYLFYPGYLSFYALILFLALPLIALLFGLLQRRRYVVGADLSAHSCRRGEEHQARFSLSTPGMDPGEEARLTVRVESLLYPQLTLSQELRLHPGEEGRLSLPLEHCGWYRLSVVRCRAADWLGWMALGLRAPEPLMTLVLPQTGQLPYQEEPAPKAGAVLRPRPGGGPGEEYELRPYRPGDPVNAIHWKLTAKQPTDEPVLRETLEPEKERWAVGYDHMGPPEALDEVLGQLEALARYLLDKGDPFTVCSFQPEDGSVRWYEVDGEKAWDSCYQAISALPAAPAGQGLSDRPRAVPGWAGPIKWIYLTPSGEQEVERL